MDVHDLGSRPGRVHCRVFVGRLHRESRDDTRVDSSEKRAQVLTGAWYWLFQFDDSAWLFRPVWNNAYDE